MHGRARHEGGEEREEKPMNEDRMVYRSWFRRGSPGKGEAGDIGAGRAANVPPRKLSEEGQRTRG